jgi:predicted CXXCH cytochrome family protein
MKRKWVVGLVMAAGLLAGAPCGECHKEASAAHGMSPHARAMQRWEGSQVEKLAGRALTDRAGFRYEFLAGVFRVGREGQEAAMPVEWVMGSGKKAQTPLLRRGGDWREARLSWYADTGRLGLTPGHALGAPFDVEDGLGVKQTAASLGRCLGCHSSGEDKPGVQCQRCHGTADRHADGKEVAGKGKVLTAGAQVAVCGQCHRSPDREFRSKTPELEDPLSVRFATVGFTASRCYRPEGQFACASCHDPHTQGVKGMVNQVCEGCHAGGAGKKSACPKEKERCVACHMRPATPAPHLTFTDHRIRVYARD